MSLLSIVSLSYMASVSPLLFVLWVDGPYNSHRGIQNRAWGATTHCDKGENCCLAVGKQHPWQDEGKFSSAFPIAGHKTDASQHPSPEQDGVGYSWQKKTLSSGNPTVAFHFHWSHSTPTPHQALKRKIFKPLNASRWWSFYWCLWNSWQNAQLL